MACASLNPSSIDAWYVPCLLFILDFLSSSCSFDTFELIKATVPAIAPTVASPIPIGLENNAPIPPNRPEPPDNEPPRPDNAPIPLPITPPITFVNNIAPIPLIAVSITPAQFPSHSFKNANSFAKFSTVTSCNRLLV